MKLSVFFNHLIQAAEQTGLPLDDMMKMAAEQGICAIESHVELIDRDPNMASRLKNAGLRVNCPYEFFGWNGAEYGDMTRLCHLIDTAAEFGADKVLVIPGFLEEEKHEALNSLLDRTEVSLDGFASPEFNNFMNECEDITKIKDMMGRAVEYGKTCGITVMIEEFDNPSSPVSRTLPILWFLKNVDGLKFAFDTGNFASADEDAFVAGELLKDYIVHTHLKDRGIEEGYENAKHSRGLATVSVGSGYIPIAEIVDWTRKNGYDGYYAIEHFQHPDQLTAIRESAKFLKSL